MRKIILSFLTVAAMATNANAQIPTAGLVGHYDFTNGALTDNINSVDFTKAGTASTNITDRFGNTNEAISLNGDDLIRADIDFDLSNSNPYLARTISFWVKTPTNDGNVRLIYNDNDRANVGVVTYIGLIVYLQNGQVKASNRVGSNGNLVTHSAAINDNNWHHVAVQAYSTETSGIKRFYTYVFIDGVKEGGNGYQASASSVSVKANEHIGDLGFSRLKGTSVNTNQKYQDGIDEILFYTRILTDTEISGIAANAPCTVTIPDANFKAYLVGNTAINTNGNTEIECSEASTFTGIIACNGLSISDLTGIEAFTALTELYCYSNPLTSLDVTQNTALTRLECNNNSLTSLDVSQNVSLEYFKSNSNSLTSLNVSQNTNLEYLHCYNNSINILDVSQNINLVYLFCNDNSLSSIDVSVNTSLERLDFSENPISNVDVSLNTALIRLSCTQTALSNLDLSNNGSLNFFSCSNNSLNSLNIANGNNSNFTFYNSSSNPTLSCIQVDNVAYSTTNWTNVDAASSFSTNCNPPCTVTIPDANFKAYLVGNITINTNGNTEIECSEATAFTGVIACNSLSISDLTGIEAFTALTSLYCYSNSLTTLDLSQNPTLTGIYCFDNLLTTLNLNQNMPLTILNCNTNQLTSLDLSGSASLTGLYCGDNQLTSLNVANGNNINMVASLDPGLYAVNNPNLTCIQIDAGYTPNSSDWAVDATVSFSTNCGTVGIDELSNESLSIYPNPVQHKLFIELANQEVTEINVIDYSGRIVKTINENVNSINVSDLQQGIYILKVATENGVLTNRFIKQ